jgi:Ni/Co efflux regulator RcnB
MIGPLRNLKFLPGTGNVPNAYNNDSEQQASSANRTEALSRVSGGSHQTDHSRESCAQLAWNTFMKHWSAPYAGSVARIVLGLVASFAFTAPGLAQTCKPEAGVVCPHPVAPPVKPAATNEAPKTAPSYTAPKSTSGSSGTGSAIPSSGITPRPSYPRYGAPPSSPARSGSTGGTSVLTPRASSGVGSSGDVARATNSNGSSSTHGPVVLTPRSAGAGVVSDGGESRQFGGSRSATLSTSSIVSPNRQLSSPHAESRSPPSRQFGGGEAASIHGPRQFGEEHATGSHPVRSTAGQTYLYHGHSFRPFRVASYHWPRGNIYYHYGSGMQLPRTFLVTQYFIADYAYYQLAAPPGGFQWVRYGPDLLLVNVTTGDVTDTVYGVFQESADPQDGSADDSDPAQPASDQPNDGQGPATDPTQN